MEEIHTDMWFCYEQAMNGQWLPHIYHDGKPGKPSGQDAPDRTPFIEVSELYLFDGEPQMDTLIAVYPAPKADTNGKSEEHS